MRNPDVIIIGGGQAGLAMSRSLAAYGIDHVVLERGRIGERWHSERWHSLHLLTTNAMSALPGLPHTDKNPDAFMPASAFASYLERYAQKMAAPVMSGVEVTDVNRLRAATVSRQPPASGTHAPSSSRRELAIHHFVRRWRRHSQPQFSRCLPRTTGSRGSFRKAACWWSAPHRPALSSLRNPWSGRPVVLAVGDHTRVPRRIADGTYTPGWKRRAFSMIRPSKAAILTPLAASHHCNWSAADKRDLDLGVLSRLGIRLVGRLAAIDGTKAEFSGDLDRTTKASHARMLRILDRIDGIQ